jgi:hypothetical protein
MAAVALFCCCSRPSQPAAPVDTAAVEHAPTPAKPSKLAVARTPATHEESQETPKVADEDLKTEEREANPYSETVTLKLSVTPQVKALVTWGAKQIAHLAPGTMETDISRPRGSGPVDLEIKADGFMPHHTRLYADRSDKVSVRLYRVEEAPGLLGFKRSAEKPEKKAPEKKK